MNRLQKIGFSNIVLSLGIGICVFKFHSNTISERIFMLISLITIIVLFVISPRRRKIRKDTSEYDELENIILLRASHVTLIVLLGLGFFGFISLLELGPELNKSLGITINQLKFAFFSVCGVGTFTRGIAILVQLMYYHSPHDSTEGDDE